MVKKKSETTESEAVNPEDQTPDPTQQDNGAPLIDPEEPAPDPVSGTGEEPLGEADSPELEPLPAGEPDEAAPWEEQSDPVEPEPFEGERFESEVLADGAPENPAYDPDRDSLDPAEIDPLEPDPSRIEPEPLDPEIAEKSQNDYSDPEPQAASAAGDPTAAPVATAAPARRGSFASKALAALLLLIGGIILGVWAAPRVGPMLPAGMAAWVTPAGGLSEDRIAALEAELAAVGSELEALRPEVDEAVSGGVGALETRLDNEIAALRGEISQMDGAETRQQIARIESALEGQIAQVQSLTSQFEEGAATITGQTEEGIDLYRGEVEGLRAEMGALSDNVASLGARIDEVAASAAQQVDLARAQVAEIEANAGEALDTAAFEADIALLRAALASGASFEEPIGRLSSAENVTVPQGLLDAAETGAPTMAQLRDSFPEAAHAAIRANILASSGDGLFARTRAFAETQIASRSLTPQPGPTPDAILSRMEDRLRNDDLAGALAEAEALPSEAAAAMAPWIEDARLRAAAEEGLATLDAPAVN